LSSNVTNIANFPFK